MGGAASGRRARRFLTDGLLLFLFVFSVFAVSMNSVWATDHATSFVQLDYALLVHHSVALGQLAHTPPSTVDNFQYGGQTYSALAPGSAFLALPFLAVAFAISGTYTAYGPALFWSETFVSAAGAIATLLLYEIARMYFRRSTSILLGLAFAFSTILWPFATFFFQSDVSAMLVLASVFFALKASRSAEKGPRLSLACGLAAGLAFTTDYVDAVVIPVLLLFLIFRRRETGMSVLVSAVAFCLGTLPGLAAIGAYNSAIFGTPFMFTESAYVGQSILAKFSTPLTYGLALNTVSLSRGVFIFAPFTLLGVLGYVDAIRGKEKKAEMLLFLALFLAILLPYSAWYAVDGGLSFGPRFIVPAIPFLIIPAGFIVEQARGYRALLVYAAYVGGAVINGMAAFVTAVPPSAPPKCSCAFDWSPLVNYVVPNFQIGNFDSMWARYLPRTWYVGAALVGLLAIALPLLWVAVERRGERRAVEANSPQGG